MYWSNEPLSSGGIVGGHYLVIDVIGTGGFSAVYLVQDQQHEENFFALKEVIGTHQESMESFTSECELLKRLTHPSLPRVYDVFADSENNRLYMLMDYVEGPNLEMLRRVQSGKRFSLPMITTILDSVVDAIEYLHRQDPPVIHRDIKPANIIVPVTGGKAILVDFGIAKEYDTQRATSSIRYGSPGYGAPEHYTYGTNARSDVYGLGATLYALLTGEVPPEAIERMTRISNENIDPLKPVRDLVPTIPLHISEAIHRSMAIKINERFASVQGFWQIIKEGPAQQSSPSQASGPFNVTSAKPDTGRIKVSTSPIATGEALKPSRKRLLLPVLLALLLLVGVGVGLWQFASGGGHNPAPPTAGTPLPGLSHGSTPVGTATLTSASYSYPQLAATYNGTIVDLQSNIPSQLILSQMQQNGGHISGAFSAMQMNSPFTGFLDTSKHIYFTVAASSGHAPLNFTGSIQKDGSLSGSFCQVDQNGQCASGLFGLWNAAHMGPARK